MTDLIDTTEMYLRTILELEEEGITPLRARISERLGHSGPNVSQTIGRMERDGLVVVTETRTLELTDAGRHALAYAQQILRMSQEMAEGADAHHEVRGEIRLATADSLCSPLMLHSFAAFRREHPCISLSVTTAGTAERYR